MLQRVMLELRCWKNVSVFIMQYRYREFLIKFRLNLIIIGLAIIIKGKLANQFNIKIIGKTSFSWHKGHLAKQNEAIHIKL